MNKKTLTILILSGVVIIIALILADFLGNRPGKRGANPYEYNAADFRDVDSSLIHYRETSNIALDDREPYGLDIYQDLIYITGKEFLQSIRPDGVQLLFKTLEGTGTCIEVDNDYIFIGFSDHIAKFDKQGELLGRWDNPGDRTFITSLALKGNTLYAADAGNRRVIRYDRDGNMLGTFTGKSEGEAGHGFIIPSAKFDLAVNSYDELWVVNPGMHALENYTDDGNQRGYWQKSSMQIEGFTGCCNPAHIAVLEDGSFVTSEKGMVRIKIHEASGALRSVVAPPAKFKTDGKAPEVAVSSMGHIYALDFDKNRIRIFEKIQP